MNKTNENRLSMFMTVDDVLDDNATRWAEIGAFVNASNSFKQTISSIVDVRQIQENSHTGITQDKHARREAMISLAMIVKGGVQAYATDTQNNDLYNSVDYSMSRIRQQTNTVSRDRALLIYNKAMNISGELADYGVTATLLSDLQLSIASYSSSIAQPRVAISNIKASTRQINELMTEANTLLKRKLDKLMIQFKATDPTFYNTYFNARQIVDSGKGSQTEVIILNPNESITVQRVINGSRLSNTGNTTLRYCPDATGSCDAASPRSTLLEPGRTLQVDLDESYVTLTNTDGTRKGSFKVKVTSTVPVSMED